MFGHEDETQNTDTNATAGTGTAVDQSTSNDGTQSAPALSDDSTTPDYIMSDPPTQTPTTDDPTASAVSSDTSADTTVTPTEPATTNPTTSASDLLNIKQQALQQLSPLVGHLDQTPEEKFRTRMMMIQASDDQSLIQPAYEAAQAITDDKARAQALLDVINEINYFTQNSEQAA